MPPIGGRDEIADFGFGIGLLAFMNRRYANAEPRSGVREIAFIILAVAALIAGGGIFVFGIGRFSQSNAQPVAIATATSQATLVTPTPVLGSTALPTSAWITHTVQDGETLTSIAALYGVTPDQVAAANSLTNPDTLFPGQELQIPMGQSSGSPAPPNLPTAPALVITFTGDPSQPDGWPRSIIEGDLDANYPLVYEHTRFRLHYQPHTYPDLHLDEVVALIESSLANVEMRLGARIGHRFDVYAAGTLFEPPDAALRGRSFSRDLKSFFLLDGSGSPAENAYLVTHELTHLVVWNTWGAPSSTMLSEGLATYIGKPELEAGGFISYDQLCLGIYAAGQMASMATIENDWHYFQGHIQNRFNYFGSACFVEYLINTYGLAAMSQLYHTSDYNGLYGKPLAALDADWQATLEARMSELTIDPVSLVEYTNEVNAAYGAVFDRYDGSPTLHQAYLAVDKARIALWQGDYASVRRWLDQVYALMGQAP